MSWSPTQRALKWLRDQGYTAEVVERWNPHARIRQDLFGFIDIVAVGAAGTLAVQATSYGNGSKRAKKIRDHENLPPILAADWVIEVHEWRKGARAPRVIPIEAQV